MSAQDITKNYRTFSGTDTVVFIMLPGTAPIVLGSLTTIAYSMYRTKKPVFNIGKINLSGVTRGPRIYAGSMVFTLINQHWLEELKDYLPYLAKYGDIKVDELPIFDLMIVSANEYGAYVSMYIYGVDFTDEAQTLSVEDLFTENVFKFVCRDLTYFESGELYSSTSNYKKGQTSANIESDIFVLSEESNYEQLEETLVLRAKNKLEMQKEALVKEEKNKVTFERELVYDPSYTLCGNDVIRVQEALNAKFIQELPLPITGVYDEPTYEAVKKYQSFHGLYPDGIYDKLTADALFGKKDTTEEEMEYLIGYVLNLSGTYLYDRPSTDGNILGTVEYKDKVKLYEVLGADGAMWYKTDDGYVLKQDIYTYGSFLGSIEFPIIQLNDSNYYVLILQECLRKLNTSFVFTPGEFDRTTEEEVLSFQRKYGFVANGIVSNDLWKYIQGVCNETVSDMIQDTFVITNTVAPGEYAMSEIKDLSAYLAGFHLQFTTPEGQPKKVKVSMTCLFDTEEIKHRYLEFLTSDKSTLALSEFAPMFDFDVNEKAFPSRMEFVVFAQGKQPYKWSFVR